MKRTPSGPRASDAAELLRLPRRSLVRRADRWVALRTFLGTAAIGVGLATAAALGHVEAGRSGGAGRGSRGAAPSCRERARRPAGRLARRHDVERPLRERGLLVDGSRGGAPPATMTEET